MSYLVMEIQKNSEGVVSNIVRQIDERENAESAYHTTLGSAAISGLPVHAVVLMAEDGFVLDRKAYKRAVAPVDMTAEEE